MHLIKKKKNPHSPLQFQHFLKSVSAKSLLRLQQSHKGEFPIQLKIKYYQHTIAKNKDSHSKKEQREHIKKRSEQSKIETHQGKHPILQLPTVHLELVMKSTRQQKSWVAPYFQLCYLQPTKAVLEWLYTEPLSAAFLSRCHKVQASPSSLDFHRNFVFIFPSSYNVLLVPPRRES